MSSLMDIIIQIENQLGWTPSRAPIHAARAAEHRKLSLALLRHNYSERDLRLALAYCVKRRQPIKAPLELITHVKAARELAETPSIPGQLDLQIRAAINWEYAQDDDVSDAWITRLVRSMGPARAVTLAAWSEGGRGR